MENVNNIALITQFIEACVRADPDEFASYFSEDATWWNSPWRPLRNGKIAAWRDYWDLKQFEAQIESGAPVGD
ncbi:MAG TPA: nuclear transport factor 2 family protein [Bryobacteraceae bacterium]|nr:nuclear transport factor 2 family protein [Bryobacteraceae bacterium]